MLDFLLDLIFPKKCVGCGKFGKFICNQCLLRIDYFDTQVCPYCERPSPYGLTHPRCQKPLGLDGMFTLAHYRGPVREAIRLIKYRSVFAVSQELAKLVGEKYHYKYNFDNFVPVPLAKKREQERGFNQAEKLAQAINTEMGNKLSVIKLLVRTRETKPQFGLKFEERKTNVRDAFIIATRHVPRAICLVDDVSTTGSTIFECAKILKRSGGKKVYAICIARGG